MRPYSIYADLEQFRAELDTNGFRSQVTGVGARGIVRALRDAGPGVVVWIRSQRRSCVCGELLVLAEDVCPTCTAANFARLTQRNQADDAGNRSAA